MVLQHPENVTITAQIVTICGVNVTVLGLAAEVRPRLTEAREDCPVFSATTPDNCAAQSQNAVSAYL